jgi:hypothetical protein
VIPGGDVLPGHPIRQHPHHCVDPTLRSQLATESPNLKRQRWAGLENYDHPRPLAIGRPSPPRPRGVACLTAKNALDERGWRRQSV